METTQELRKILRWTGHSFIFKYVMSTDNTWIFPSFVLEYLCYAITCYYVTWLRDTAPTFIFSLSIYHLNLPFSRIRVMKLAKHGLFDLQTIHVFSRKSHVLNTDNNCHIIRMANYMFALLAPCHILLCYSSVSWQVLRGCHSLVHLLKMSSRNDCWWNGWGTWESVCQFVTDFPMVLCWSLNC